MPILSVKSTARNIDSVRYAREWLKRGIAPVPLRSRSKRPKGGKGWNTVRVTNDTIPRFFERGDNIGGLWGEPSGWIVDLDLDWDEAIPIAAALLPSTFTYGRGARVRSHYLYRVPGATSLKCRIKTEDADEDETLLEVRSTGSQSVLPPSVHPEGDRYEVNDDIEFKTLTPIQLQRYAYRIAAATLLARRYPESGARHDYVHATTGMLLHRGWEAAQVREFMLAVIDAAADSESDAPQRRRTVDNTIRSFEEGDRVWGWTTLSQWLDGKDLSALRAWIEHKAAAVTVIQSGDTAPDKREEKIVPPPDILEIPGLVGEVAKWARDRSFARQPLFDVAVGLTLVAAASGNKYVIDAWNTPLQPYLLMLAPTASGKESALDSIGTALRRIDLPNVPFRGFQSYHAMLDTLAVHPHIAVWLWDEAARKLRTAMRSTAGQDYQIVTHLLELYGKGYSTISGMPGRKHSIESIDRPFLSIVAAAQPAQLVEAITDSDLSLGLINRFVLLDGGNHLAEDNFDRKFIFPSKLEAALKSYRELKPPTNGGEFPVIHVHFETVAAHNMFRDFHRRCREMAVRGGGWEMWGRANQNALILAGIVAVGISPKQPLITTAIAAWATKFLEWCSDRWVQRIEECSARSMAEAGSKFIERTIRNARSFEHRTLGHPGEVRMLRRGYMPRALLMRMSRHIRPKEFEESIGSLVTMSIACFGEVDGVECYWIK